MDDPWDVKSVRLAGQYTSCMKISGVPLLPPVLSKECREEMQYYKLLAKEVEKRISILEPYVCSEKESQADRSEHNSIEVSPLIFPHSSSLQPETQEIVQTPQEQDITINSTQLVVDFSLCINQTNVSGLNSIPLKSPCPSEDLPVRDYDCSNKKELLLDTETSKSQAGRITNRKLAVKEVSDTVNISVRLKDDNPTESVSPTDSEDLKSVASKTFSGSLNDIFTKSTKEQDSQLMRQRSYTILNPSPQLLAHLEVQSLNTGVEMSKISMSESLSNISYSPNKKRRSWDLESAKVKWSSMALELKQKNINKNNKANSPTKTHSARPQFQSGPVRLTSPTRVRSVADKRPNSGQKSGQKSEPIRNARKPSPPRNIASSRNIVQEPKTTRKWEVQSPKSPKSPTSPKSPKSPKHLPMAEFPIEDHPTDDPATRVRELYDKIQKQQLLQMASLVEKQKREQLLLQQVFEEQNNLLFKQLKTICPKSPIEAKEAWGEKHEAERGPVSLSQLINHKPDQSMINTPASPYTKDYINHSNNVLKSSRTVSHSPNGRPKSSSNKSPPNGSITRTHSPSDRTHISRRLNYETSASSERELEPMLTDRTSDTMADVNVTFPEDSDTSYSNKSKETSVIYATSDRHGCSSTDSAVRSLERTIRNSMNNSNGKNRVHCNPTAEQRAAASIIVAHARGYLVRRLFRTERVQTTVQTIKDALLCALQLHQDREGIRGADVDLHRRLIQQITAACYTLHDTFVSSTPRERCAMIAADRERRKSLANRPPVKPSRPTREIMSQSHCGAFTARPKRSSTSTMTQSTHESYNTERSLRARYMPSPRPRPWR